MKPSRIRGFGITSDSSRNCWTRIGKFRLRKTRKSILRKPTRQRRRNSAAIPQHFQDAYKSLSPGQREEFSYMTPERQQEFLQDKADALKAREYIAQQEAAQAEARRQQEQQFQQRRTARRGIGAICAIGLDGERKAKLQAEAKFSRMTTSTARYTKNQLLGPRKGAERSGVTTRQSARRGVVWTLPATNWRGSFQGARVQDASR